MASRFNSSHLEYHGAKYNESLLDEFNYNIYHNGTISNETYCYLIFKPYNISMLPNGTVTGTPCDTPVLPIATRGALGIAFGSLFCILVILALSCLKKHGRSYLPAEQRFRLVSRRWQWYWMLVTAACAAVSCFTGIDVDRDYMQGTALILQNVFYCVTLPVMLASVWEMTRHWGSFCERQLVDEDNFRFRQDDKRSKIEFYMPLGFYLFAFLAFFLSVLRSWTPIPRGNVRAIEAATDPRFRASSIFAFFAFCLIAASVVVSAHYYPPVSSKVPIKILLCLLLILVRIGYTVAVAWEYDIGPLKFNSSPGYIYGLGYAPLLLIMIVMVLAAWREPNDDQEIKRQRRERELRNDRELGLRNYRDDVEQLKVFGSGETEDAIRQKK